MLIYKIFRASEWAALQRDGKTAGAPVDVADGFVHFSTAEQAAETLGIQVNRLGYRVSRGGALFPHLYRDLCMADVLWSCALPLGPEGHEFPEDMT